MESGNCYEQANLAFDYLVKQGISPVELFSMIYGDHVFVVIGRNPNTNAADPTTWNADAIICDPWAGEVYSAKDFIFGLNTVHRSQDRKETLQSVGFPNLLKCHPHIPIFQMMPFISPVLSRIINFHTYFYDTLTPKEHLLLNKIKANLYLNSFIPWFNVPLNQFILILQQDLWDLKMRC